MKDVLKKDLQWYLEELKSCSIKTKESIETLASVYCEAITKYPDIKSIVREQISYVSPSFWTKLENIGNGLLSAGLLMDRSLGAIRLQNMPMSDQEKYVKEPFQVLTSIGDTLLVNLHDLSFDQANQVFAGDHIRDLGGQRAYLESKKTQYSTIKSKPKEVYIIPPVKPYTISNGKITFNANSTFTSKELLDIYYKLAK